jgi:hypothetical protein
LVARFVGAAVNDVKRLTCMHATRSPLPLSAGVTPRRDAAQEAGEIVGDVIDVGRIATGQLPFLAEDFAGA